MKVRNDDFNRAQSKKLQNFLQILKTNWGNEDRAKQGEITAKYFP